MNYTPGDLALTFNEAHIRNLKIQIIKLASQRGEDINSVINNLYSENEIHDKFYFRKNDIHEYKANFFESHGTEYHFRNLMTERLKEYSGKHKEGWIYNLSATAPRQPN